MTMHQDRTGWCQAVPCWDCWRMFLFGWLGMRGSVREDWEAKGGDGISMVFRPTAGVVLISVKPSLENMFTLREWPALIEDMPETQFFFWLAAPLWHGFLEQWEASHVCQVPFHVRSFNWYYEYRQIVFKLIAQAALDDHAPGPHRMVSGCTLLRLLTHVSFRMTWHEGFGPRRLGGQRRWWHFNGLSANSRSCADQCETIFGEYVHSTRMACADRRHARNSVFFLIGRSSLARFSWTVRSQPCLPGAVSREELQLVLWISANCF